MTMPATTMHDQVRNSLVDDPVLTMLGFDHRTIGEQIARTGQTLRITWSDTWYGSRDAALGVVTIDIGGVSPQARDAVLDRVEIALDAGARRPGPITRIRRVSSASASFRVLCQRQSGQPRHRRARLPAPQSGNHLSVQMEPCRPGNAEIRAGSADAARSSRGPS